MVLEGPWKSETNTSSFPICHIFLDIMLTQNTWSWWAGGRHTKVSIGFLLHSALALCGASVWLCLCGCVVWLCLCGCVVCVAVSSATLTPSPTNPTISRNAIRKRSMATDNQLVRGLGGSGRHCWANQKRLIFFCVQIYLHLWMYLSTPLTHLQNGIPNLLQNGGAWHWHMILFSYKVMLGVYKQVSFYKMECPDGKKKHKIWFIGSPGPTILNGKCQQGVYIYIYHTYIYTPGWWF